MAHGVHGLGGVCLVELAARLARERVGADGRERDVDVARRRLRDLHGARDVRGHARAPVEGDVVEARGRAAVAEAERLLRERHAVVHRQDRGHVAADDEVARVLERVGRALSRGAVAEAGPGDVDLRLVDGGVDGRQI